MQSLQDTAEPETPRAPQPKLNESGRLKDQRGLHALSLVFEVSNRIHTNLIPAIFASFSVVTGGIIGLYIGIAIFGFAIAFSIIRFLTFRYRLTDSELLIDQGLIFRTHRSVPLSNIQNIDSIQNIFHRFFQVAEVRIETASGNEPEATMRVLSIAEVDRLRDRILGIATSSKIPVANVETSSEATAPSTTSSIASARSILEIPTHRLILAGLLSNRGLVLAGIAFGYFWQAQFSGFDPFSGKVEEPTKENVRGAIRGTILSFKSVFDSITESMTGQAKSASGILLIVLMVLLLVLVLRLFSAAWYVIKFHGYRLTLRDEELHIRCGLFTKISATVPRQRIQVISIHRSWLARFFGLASIRVETTGGGTGQQSENAATTMGRHWFVPILAMRELEQVLHAMQPNIEWESIKLSWKALSPRARKRLVRLPMFLGIAFLFASLVQFFTPFRNWAGITAGASIVWMALSLWVCAKKSKSRKYATSETQILFRSGILMQKTSIGFLDRIQSVDLIQSPFDRNWKMATLKFDTAGAGPAEHLLVIEMLDADDATREFERLNYAI
jgi:putative membrane protein